MKPFCLVRSSMVSIVALVYMLSKHMWVHGRSARPSLKYGQHSSNPVLTGPPQRRQSATAPSRRIAAISQKSVNSDPAAGDRRFCRSCCPSLWSTQLVSPSSISLHIYLKLPCLFSPHSTCYVEPASAIAPSSEKEGLVERDCFQKRQYTTGPTQTTRLSSHLLPSDQTHPTPRIPSPIGLQAG